MSQTRSKSLVYLIGESQEHFCGRVLPTGLEVLKVYFHRHKKYNESRSAVKAVVQEICEIWERARVPTCEERSIIRKLDRLLDRHRNICRNKNRKTSVQHAKEQEFLKSIQLLFDIAHHDALNQIKIEEDKTFLIDQHLERNYIMGAIDRKLAQMEKRKVLRSESEAKKREKEELRKQKVKDTVNSAGACASVVEGFEFSLHEDSSDDDDFVDESAWSTSKKPKLRAVEVVSQDLSNVLDRTNTSNRAAAFLLTTAAQSAQSYSGKNASELPFSTSSIRRSRIKHRTQHAANIKSAFLCDGHLVCHFDGKLLPAITGGAEKVDRLAILVSGYEMEKLLGVPKVFQGSGEQVAQKVLETLTDWNIGNQVVGMSFDTTAANTGRQNGACVLIEKKMEKQLLWLACRHHMLEVVCGDVFKTVFGPTSGPDVLLFKRFQKQWPNINKTQYQPCTDESLSGDLLELKTEAMKMAFDVLEGKVGKVPREDYKELMELTVLFLGKTPPHGIRFRVPGAFHHARWMSKLLYVLKISMFQTQFKITKRESESCLQFALFATLIYAKAWITSSFSCDAPVNDLNLIRTLTNYRKYSDNISTSALKALNRHLWYLSQELVPLSLFSDLVASETKQQMVTRLKDALKIEGVVRSVRYTEKDDLSNKSLDDFIGPASGFFFNVLKLDISFFNEEVASWPENPSFQIAKKTARQLKVVNDTSERGIALATTFNLSISKQEEQKQYLLQVVESHRKRYPNANKGTLYGQE